MSNRRLLAKVSAPIAALVTLGFFMFLPMYIFRLTADIPLDAQGSNGEIWFLIIGGGLGAGAAYLTVHAILTKIGGFSENEVEAMWHGRKRNT